MRDVVVDEAGRVVVAADVAAAVGASAGAARRQQAARHDPLARHRLLVREVRIVEGAVTHLVGRRRPRAARQEARGHLAAGARLGEAERAPGLGRVTRLELFVALGEVWATDVRVMDAD